MAEPAPSPPPAPQEVWYKGSDDVVVGYLQSRGIADKPAPEVLKNLMEAHVNAEKMIGAPANELVRWPKASDDPNWEPLRARLGVPKDATGYDFSTIKAEDGTALVDGKFAETLRSTLHRLNIGTEAGVELAKALAKFASDEDTSELADTRSKQAAEQETLKTTWGANYEANRVAALGTLNKMLEASGMKQEDAATAINALENGVGGAKVMEMFRAFSTMARESTFGGGGGPQGGNVLSFQEALATKQALLRDDAFVAKWNAGDMDAGKRLEALDRIIVANTPESDEAIFRRQLAEQAGRR